MSFPDDRLRRLRRTPQIRRLVQEARLGPEDLILPCFVAESISARREVATMPGVFQETVESLLPVAREAVELGLKGMILFGVPAHKDPRGSSAWDEQGVVQRALRGLRREFGDTLVLLADTCLDEYTDHGHCGILTATGEVDNDATLELYGLAAVSQARAGADVVAPSGMMDGQVGAIRAALDENGFSSTAILAYSAKFASCFYGPFREAAECAPKFGDRRSYQMNPGNRREAMRELELDLLEGADMLMVKPALSYLDLVREARDRFDLPLGCYSVSGEYSMLRAAAAAGALDLRSAVMETHLSMRRAGADFILTYFAREICGWLKEDA
ncbi:MAG TPA: porphobilinogen synthase [Candidatus Nanopelagicaceae bacterium]|nr:porphobilinogen synthase [Candidatus Nanopelagicaceae bacterium]